MPGPRRDFGPKQRVDNPMKVFGRIMSYVLKRYPIHCAFVLICIFVSVYANTQGTMFMKTLIDGYITPLLGQANPDYSELLQAIIKMGILYSHSNAGSISIPTETKNMAPKRSFTGLIICSICSASMVSAKIDPMTKAPKAEEKPAFVAMITIPRHNPRLTINKVSSFRKVLAFFRKEGIR